MDGLCPRCKTPHCSRWDAEQKASPLPAWKQKEYDDDCAFRANACLKCKGQCCRDVDLGYRVEHMGAEVYQHDCDYCLDGQVPPPMPAGYAEVEAVRAELKEKAKEWRADAIEARQCIVSLQRESTQRAEKIALLCEAIAKWPAERHAAGCRLNDYGDYTAVCSCGAAERNRARADARMLAGLGD